MIDTIIRAVSERRRYYVDVIKLEDGNYKYEYSSALIKKRPDVIISPATKEYERSKRFIQEQEDIEIGETRRIRLKIINRMCLEVR